MTPDLKKLLDKARLIRRGAAVAPGDDPFQIAKSLAKARRLDDARRLMEHVYLVATPSTKARQQWALWTSKNPDASDRTKHDEALEVLGGTAEILASNDPETQGIAGGICKRKWMALGDRDALEQALEFYELGAQGGVVRDDGYNAVNAAFVRDLIASLDNRGRSRSDHAIPTAEATAHRQSVINDLLPLEDQPADAPRSKQRWFHETIAEAYFGLKQYDKAIERLKRVVWETVEPWEREATARQFAWLARLQSPADVSFDQAPAWRVLSEVFGGDAVQGAGSLFAGKLGVALSGGGFRASFFHIGVLAGLAELDVLRHVEVLSCVSGGSIVGAHFYLKIRELLRKRGKADRQDYVNLVQELASEFLAGVQKNLRMRVALNPLDNLKMAFWPRFSRTSRLAKLYEKHLYARIKDDEQRKLRLLQIAPGGDTSFQPKYDNWRRSSKVPISIINATTLNTGHNWQFTTSWMGEPPDHIDDAVDANYRLRRMYIEDEAPAVHRDISIGEAVAASACVPGMFPPLKLRGLYKGEDEDEKPIDVQLVDGGVHDNQGIYGLLDQDCQVVVVSDATGQMGTDDNAGAGLVGTLKRSNEIAMARIRTAQFHALTERLESDRLRGLLYVHLKDELPVFARDWVGCENPKAQTLAQMQKDLAEVTSFGILKATQEKLANVRTDLDSFTDVEAYALMTDGCLMIRAKGTAALRRFQTDSKQEGWDFLAIKDQLAAPAGSAKATTDQLAVSAQNAFKVWRLHPVLRWVAIALGIGVLAVLVVTALGGPGVPAQAATTILVAGASAAGLGFVVKAIKYRTTAYEVMAGITLALLASVIVWLHLQVFDRIFLRLGKYPR